MKHTEYIQEDYVHSANSLFHFMKSQSYLIDALKRKALCPRFCNEDIEYLNIQLAKDYFREVSILQKCFCDIPLSNVIKQFPIKLTEKNNLTEHQRNLIPEKMSHPDLYGKYALAFSKRWGEKNKLQPIHYLNEDSYCSPAFSTMFNAILSSENVSNEIADTLLNWLSFVKPIRGKMIRRIRTDAGENFTYEIYKNFHDEHEWRFVPFNTVVNGELLESVIANNEILQSPNLIADINNGLERITEIRMPFNYEDLRYIIVPDADGRIAIIKAILEIDGSAFGDDEQLRRSVLISKILVLEDIAKDF